MYQSKPQTDWPGWEQLTPVLRYGNFYDAKPGGGYGPRYIPDFQLILVQAGQGIAHIDATTSAISAGDVFTYGPNVRHHVVSSVENPLRLLGLLFVYQAQDNILLQNEMNQSSGTPYALPVYPTCPLSPPPPTFARYQTTSAFRKCFENLVLSYVVAPTGRSLEKRGLLLQLFELWRDAISEPDNHSISVSHRRLVSGIQESILTDLAVAPPLSEVAAHAGISVSYLHNLFRRQSGQTIPQFHREMRLQAARRLLVEGQLNVAEVARSVGYEDYFYFSRLFRRRFGTAPSLVRRQHHIT